MLKKMQASYFAQSKVERFGRSRLNAIYSRLMGNEARLLAPGGFVANVLIFR